MVAALDDDFRSLFRGKKPKIREDRSKRARRFDRRILPKKTSREGSLEGGKMLHGTRHRKEESRTH